MGSGSVSTGVGPGAGQGGESVPGGWDRVRPQAARGLHRSASANALLHAGAADSPGRAMLSPPVQRANTFKASVVRVLRV